MHHSFRINQYIHKHNDIEKQPTFTYMGQRHLIWILMSIIDGIATLRFLF